MSDDFKLTPGERNNPLWAKLERYLNDRLEMNRRKNDGDLEPLETAKVRGRIAVIKDLLALAKDPAAGPSDS